MLHDHDRIFRNLYGLRPLSPWGEGRGEGMVYFGFHRLLVKQPAPSPGVTRRPLHVMAEPCFAWTGRGDAQAAKGECD